MEIANITVWKLTRHWKVREQIDTIEIFNFHLKDNEQRLDWHEIKRLETKVTQLKSYGLN